MILNSILLPLPAEAGHRARFLWCEGWSPHLQPLPSHSFKNTRGWGGAGTGGTRESLGPHQPEAVILKNPFVCRFLAPALESDTQPSSLPFPDPGPAGREAGVFAVETSPGLASFPHLGTLVFPTPPSPAFPTFRSPDAGFRAGLGLSQQQRRLREGRGGCVFPACGSGSVPAMRAMPGIHRFPSIFGFECHCFLKWMGVGGVNDLSVLL